MITIVGWLGNIGFLIGAYLLSNKNRYGFHCQILANICYIIFSLLMSKDGLSLCVLSLILVMLNYMGLRNWKKENSQWINISN